MRPMPQLIKHVGRGARLARDLDRDEAREAMRRIVASEVDPVQIGGFLIAQRMKGESPEELAGFAEGMRSAVPPVKAPPGQAVVDVDLHADGREGRPCVTPAAACLAAAAGARVLVRGAFGQRFAANDLDQVFTLLDIRTSA